MTPKQRAYLELFLFLCGVLALFTLPIFLVVECSKW